MFDYLLHSVYKKKFKQWHFSDMKMVKENSKMLSYSTNEGLKIVWELKQSTEEKTDASQ